MSSPVALPGGVFPRGSGPRSVYRRGVGAAGGAARHRRLALEGPGQGRPPAACGEREPAARWPRVDAHRALDAEAPTCVDEPAVRHVEDVIEHVLLAYRDGRAEPQIEAVDIGLLWLVDPTDRTLEAFERHDGQWLLIASAKDDAPIRIRPFDAITFSVADRWPSPGDGPDVTEFIYCRVCGRARASGLPRSPARRCLRR